MPFNGEDVIEGARGLDRSFSPQNHPVRVCLEFLTRYQRRLAGKLLQREKEIISSGITFDLPLDDFTAGLPLQSESVDIQFDRMHGFHLVNSDQEGEEYPLPIVPFKARMTALRTLYGWIRENTLFLVGTAADWTAYTGIVFTYAPTPGAVELDKDLILPDSALDVTVLALGAELGKRLPEKLQRKTIVGEAKDAENDYLNLIEERNDVEVGTVRRVFSAWP
ncbi:MAG: hypothetical protein KAJ42_04030 [Gemmatimonadetes bacterium]|nr:hypothetical protein [Gemmatimonadota bacterium]